MKIKSFWLFTLLTSLLCVHGQNIRLSEWYDTISMLSIDLQRSENVTLKKYVLYNGSIVPVAHGKIMYISQNEEADTLLFLYHYGSIILDKDDFFRMWNNTTYSTNLKIQIAFQPYQVEHQKKIKDGETSIVFIEQSRWIKDLYRNDILWLIGNFRSYWTITTIGKAYKVLGQDHCTGYWYYNIPDGVNKKRMEKKLDKLWSKQYKKGFNLLNYF